MRRKKRCPYCGKLFCPHSRLGDRQITCGNTSCKQQQQKHRYNCWKRNNLNLLRDNQRDWRQNHVKYWKRYRRKHPEYVKRNRIQTRLRKSLSKTGLQNNADILQRIDSQMEFWSFQRFAKQPRSIFPLLFVYDQARKQRSNLMEGFT